MPYIDNKRKAELEQGDSPKTPGELNYAITTLVVSYTNSKSLCYNTINEVVGALDCAKIEYYRRLAVPYENKKIEINGDVYPEELI